MNPKKYIGTLREYSPDMTGSLLFDCVWTRLRYGFNTEEFFSLDLPAKSARERRKHVSGRDAKYLRRYLNDFPQEDKEIIHNKYSFDVAFKDFVHRDFIYTEGTTEEEIRIFVKEHKKVLAKPIKLTQGKGIQMITTNNVEKLCVGGISGFYLLEEFVVQHERLAELNPTSVNTVRVMTLKDSRNEIHILGACLRVGGKDSIVDNFHSGGVVYPIDLESGVVCGKGVGTNGVNNVIFHPSTLKCVLGFEIPYWQLLCSSVKSAAKLTKLRLIGWDIAITPDSIDFIEANDGAHFAIIETDHGVKKEIKRILRI